MASDPKPSSPNFGGNAFVWVAIVAAVLAYVSGRPSLNALRPADNEIVTTRTSIAQDVDARLWQDPFEAVLKADGEYYGWTSAKGRKIGPIPQLCNGKDPKQKDIHCQSPIGEESSSALIVGVIVPGGPYSEDAEFRRRTRYAVLAALDVLGYTPKDSQHVGVFIPRPMPAGRDGSSSDAGSLQFVPYEVLQRGTARLTLLWLGEEALGDDPLRQLANLYSALGPGLTSDFKILGPQGSDTLLAMLQHASEWQVRSDGPRLDLYDYSATADPAALCRGVQNQGCGRHKDWVTREFNRPGSKVNFSRATATDDVLARAISIELNRRGIVPGRAHMALISEWDTFYGRNLPETFARCLQGGPMDGSCDERSSFEQISLRTGSWLSRYSYLRGLDGQSPGTLATTQTSHPPASTGTSSAGTPSTPASRLSDLAQGEGQGDYLERLATALRHEDMRLRDEGGDGIRAVGILGSDLYDKLLVFQAVKSALPRAVFFTTDLDQRLIRPAQQLSTVNLLVATGLGLSLRHRLQRDVPPFRGSYQTAAFLATLMAACAPGTTSNCVDSPNEQNVSGWFERAETYEIGRTRAIPLLSEENRPSGVSRTHDCITGTGDVDVFTCASILPNESPQRSSTGLLLGLAILEAGTVLGLSALLLRMAIGPRLFVFRWLTALLLAGVVGAIQLLDPALVAPINVTLLFEGVSLWPSICIQLLSIAFGIAVMFYVRRRADKNLAGLRTRLFMNDIIKSLEGKRPKRVRDVFPFGLRTWAEAGRPNDDSEQAAAESARKSAGFWVRYVDYARGKIQIYRITGLTLLGWGAACAVHLAFPWPTPAAGLATTAIYHVVSVLDGLMTLVVAFYVADITLYSRLFVREAFARGSRAPVWSLRAKEKFADSSLHTAFNAKDAAQDVLVTTTMTIAYVSERTMCITSFIYYPFILIALSVIARSPVLSSSTFDPWAITVEAVSLLVAFVSAVALRSAAEDARSETMRHLYILKWRSLTPPTSTELRERLELLLARVSALREGAFSPLSQQPVVRALLLPLASYGSTLLLSFLSAGR